MMGFFSANKLRIKKQHDQNSKNMELECFIVIHEKELIKKCEEEGRFNNLPNYTYLFVGDGSSSGLENFSNVIIVRELPDNIEHFPNLLSFTAWYAVAKNGLAGCPWVALLEYDVKLNRNFAEKTLSALKETKSLVGYLSFPLSHHMYMHATPWLIPSFRKIYGINLPKLVDDHLADGNPDQWTKTTNAAMSIDDLQTFVNWFLPMTSIFRHDPIGAHVHERTLPIFCLLNGIRNHLVEGVLKHQQNRSHGIYALSWEAAEQEADRIRTHSTDEPLKNSG